MRSGNCDIHENGRSTAEILADMKNESVEFARIRVAMLQTELREAWGAARYALPWAAVAVVFMSTAFLLLTAALAGIVVAAFPNNPYRWFFGCLFVGAVWGFIGGAAAMSVRKKLRARNIIPKRTLEVLKRDKVWIQTEIRNRV